MAGEEAASTKRPLIGTRTRQSGFKNSNGKSAIAKRPAQPPIRCPECSSQRVWKDGLRHPRSEGQPIQRYLCRTCGFRFSESSLKSHVELGVRSQPSKFLHSVFEPPKNRVGEPNFTFKEALNGFSLRGRKDVRPQGDSTRLNAVVAQDLNTLPCYNSTRRVCVSEGETKNLAEVESQIEKRAAGATEKLDESETKQRLVEFAWWMKKLGYADETIRCNVSALKILTERGADIHSAESVREVIAKQKWSGNRRKNVINAYTLFLKMHGSNWDKPKCTVEQKIPFIPTEQEINAQIAGAGKKLAAFLQLLKETAMRAGEAVRLEWTDIDFERRIITLNKPEKRSNSRMWRVSNELIAMLKNLPKINQKVFGNATYNTFKQALQRTRKRLAHTLQNPRLEKITLHTFRHWKATMLYHQTKDPYYVKQFLGHKTLKNTEIYITVERTIFGEYSDEFIVKVATKPEEVKAAIEAGFEYVCQKDDLTFFRKRR